MGVGGWFFFRHNPSVPSFIIPTPLPLARYSFTQLQKQTITGGEITWGDEIENTSFFTARLFSYPYEDKRISGLAHIPHKSGKLPTIIMLRGYVDKEEYQSGIGTRHAAEIFARNGFITMAPDFLGYASSSAESFDVLEDRFSRPSQVLALISSFPTFSSIDLNRIGMWGHSNGGQIALSVLEISKKPIPTTLWAPVSKSFPYAMLYYTDELSDQGKYLRHELARFESDYDVLDYSIDGFFSNIAAPLLIHQGTSDEAVPKRWSDELVDKLKILKKEVTYYTYPGLDHNMTGSWNMVVDRDVAFFQKHLR